MKILRTLVISLATICILFAGCSKEKEPTNSAQVATVKVHVSDFAVSQEVFPGGTKTTEDPADYNGVNAMTLAFYNAAGTEVVKTTQLKSDNTTFTTFGEFECSLPMGSYTMVVLAYYTNENSVLTLTSPTVASYSLRARETFATTQTVTISNTNDVDISAILSRIVSMLTVKSTDGKTADVTNVRMTLSAGGIDFNPTTGLAITNTGFANTVGNSAAVGSTSTSSTVLFLNSDEQTMDVTIETLDADGNTLFSKTVNNVPFKRNRVTKLTGAMYTNSGVDGGFQISTDWLTEYNGQF